MDLDATPTVRRRERFDDVCRITCVVIVASACWISATGYDDVIVGGLFLCMIVLMLATVAVFHRMCLRRPVRAPIVVGLVCVSALISVIVTQWPLRVSYALVKRNLDAMADKMREGEALPMPQRAGLLSIQSAELSNHGIVCLWTQLHESGNTGFVQCGPDNIPFNLWSVVRLGPDWQFISED